MEASAFHTKLQSYEMSLAAGKEYLNYRCKNPMDAGCPSGSTSSRRFPGGLIFLRRGRANQSADCRFFHSQGSHGVRSKSSRSFSMGHF